jgi:hypothetical protein
MINGHSPTEQNMNYKEEELYDTQGKAYKNAQDTTENDHRTLK